MGPEAWDKETQELAENEENLWATLADGHAWGSTKEVSVGREKGCEGFPGTVGEGQALLTVLNLVELRTTVWDILEILDFLS